MYAFLCKFAPRSVNAQRKVAYYNSLVYAFQHYHHAATPMSQSLYGMVYYFHRVKTDLDADNLSKPVWDALKSVAYLDDKQIRFRCSSVFDLQVEDISVLDMSNMPEHILEDFLEVLDTKENHVLYVEMGDFDYTLFQFDMNVILRLGGICDF